MKHDWNAHIFVSLVEKRVFFLSVLLFRCVFSGGEQMSKYLFLWARHYQKNKIGCWMRSTRDTSLNSLLAIESTTLYQISTPCVVYVYIRLQTALIAGSISDNIHICLQTRLLPRLINQIQYFRLNWMLPKLIATWQQNVRFTCEKYLFISETQLSMRLRFTKFWEIFWIHHIDSLVSQNQKQHRRPIASRLRAYLLLWILFQEKWLQLSHYMILRGEKKKSYRFSKQYNLLSKWCCVMTTNRLFMRLLFVQMAFGILCLHR